MDSSVVNHTIPKEESKNPIVAPRKDSHDKKASDCEESKMNCNIPQSSLPPDGGAQVINPTFIMELLRNFDILNYLAFFS